jgi:hypothetical protein
LSGKFIVAGLLAASTASAATVGVVYTRVAEPRHAEATVVASDAPSAPSSVKSAVVLDAQDGFFEHFAGSGDAPVCPSKDEPGGCVMVSRASAIRLNILGYTVTIPAVWLGGDSEDRYFAQDSSFPWLENGPSPGFGPWIVIGRRRVASGASDPQTDGGNPTTGSQSQQQSQSASGTSAAVETVSLPAVSPTVTVPSDHVDVSTTTIPEAATVADTLEQSSPLPSADDDFAPVPTSWPESDDPSQPAISTLPGPLPSEIQLQFDPLTITADGNVPEPSTWLMMLAGLVTFGLLKRRRIIAAVRSAAR